jgi:hypothetical protein
MTCFDHSHDPDYGGRWRMDVRPLVTLPIDVAPTLADVGIEPRRVRRQSHIRLDIPEYERCRDLTLARASRDVDDLGPECSRREVSSAREPGRPARREPFLQRVRRRPRTGIRRGSAQLSADDGDAERYRPDGRPAGRRPLLAWLADLAGDATST